MGTALKLLPEHIAAEQPVIHPALDWRDGMLLMGVRLAIRDGRAVITSRGEILDLNRLAWPICDRAGNFTRSPVTERVAQLFREGYGAPGNLESAYALANIPAQLAAYYRRFVVFPSPWWPEVLALWTLGTYVYPIFNAYPYVRLASPEPGCGKSLLGQIIANLSFNGELMVSPTEANIFRLAESDRGTQVWDEVENEYEAERNRLQAMRSVLLNGYRSGGVVPRQERASKGQFTTIRFHVYVPRVLIGLSDLPEVVQQRTIELMLHRRSAAEQVERYRLDEREREEAALRELCALFALRYCNAIWRHYAHSGLAERLERHLGQAGRLPDDLLLPLFAVAAAPLDKDQRSRRIIWPLLRMLFDQVAPALSHRWNEGARSPLWLSAALHALEESAQLTPAEVAVQVSQLTGGNWSPERLSRQLARYGIRSEKRDGKRVFEVETAEIAQLRERYNIPRLVEPAAEATVPADLGQDGQEGQRER